SERNSPARHTPCGLGPNALAAPGARSRVSLVFKGRARHAALKRRASAASGEAAREHRHAESIMAGGVNKVILVGNLGADPEVRRTQDGRPIVNLRVATSETWRDKNTGERREKTEWHRVVIFSEGLAKIAEQYLKKGSKVYLEGALQTRKWQDKD